MKCKYEGSGWAEGRCMGTKEVDPCPGYEKCDRFKPNYKTNADHIRSMTDKELAKILVFWEDDWGRWWTDMGCIYGSPDNIEEALKAELEWLKQPYKEATDD